MSDEQYMGTEHEWLCVQDYHGLPRTKTIKHVSGAGLQDVLRAFGEHLRGCGYEFIGAVGIMEDGD